MKQQRIAVIGGGISGLTCAWELKRAGFQVTVYEREATVGGRMNTRVKAGFAFDIGADFLADCYSNTNQLAEEMGVEIRSVGPVRHVFLRQGRLYDMNFSSIGDVMRFGGLSLASRLRLLLVGAYVRIVYPKLDFFDLSNLPPSLRSGNAYDLCRKVVGTDFADYIVDSFSTCMMFYRARDISAGAFLSLFSMMIRGTSFGVRRADGSMRALPRALAARLDVRTCAPVDRIKSFGSGVLIQSDGAIHEFDAVVLATPANVALSSVENPTTQQRDLLQGTRYSKTIDVSFRIPKDTLEGVHCFYVPFVESTLISEFTNEAIKGPQTVSDDWTLVNVGLHDGAARDLIHHSNEEIFAMVKQELIRVCPPVAAIAGQLIPHDLQRWNQAIPLYTAEQVDRVRAFWKEGQGERNLYFCGDYLNHPWIEGAVRCGKKVAARIVEDRLTAPQQTPRVALPDPATRLTGLVSQVPHRIPVPSSRP